MIAKKKKKATRSVRGMKPKLPAALPGGKAVLECFFTSRGVCMCEKVFTGALDKVVGEGEEG